MDIELLLAEYPVVIIAKLVAVNRPCPAPFSHPFYPPVLLCPTKTKQCLLCVVQRAQLSIYNQ